MCFAVSRPPEGATSSESSPASSHTSSGSQNHVIMDLNQSSSASFSQRVNHLLTPNERNHLTQILTTYNRERWVVFFQPPVFLLLWSSFFSDTATCKK